MPTPVTRPRVARRRRFGIVLLQSLIVVVSVAVTSVVAIAAQERSIRDATRERVLAVAQSLAALDQVVASVSDDRGEATRDLQPLADLIEQSAGVDYVVITDAAGIRITHPMPVERGLPVSTDPSEVLAGGTFVGTEAGTLGPTLRAKVPVLAGDEVVGTASVGILESEMAADFEDGVSNLLPWIIGSVLVGVLASAILGAVLDRQLRCLEADSRELDVQRRIGAALRDQTHEFRTRLHVVRGLIAEGEPGEALEYIGRIVPVATGAGDPGAGADPASRALFAALAAELGERGVSLVVDADATPLGEDDHVVLANLCRNAGESGAATVRVVVRSGRGRILLRVDDDGPGVWPADATRIFERGVTSKSDTTGTGRGVGLDLVHRTVVARAGTVEVGRSPSGGARFTVELPARAEEGR